MQEVFMALNREALETESSGDVDTATRIAEEIENHIRKRALDVLNQAKNVFDHFSDLVRAGILLYDESSLDGCPNQVVNSLNQYKAFIQIRDGVYSGPSAIQELSEWADTENKVQDTIHLSELVTSQDGQMILLNRLFESPNYTIAHAKRDLKLLQLRPPQKVSEVSDLIIWTKNAVKNSQEYASQQKSLSLDSKTRLMSEVTARHSVFQNEINKKTASAIESYNKMREVVKISLGRGVIFNDYGGRIIELAKQRTNYYNLDLYSYIVTHEPTKFEVATKDEFNTAENFSKLLKRENHFLPLHLVEQASAFTIKPNFTFDCARFEVDLKSTAEAFRKALETETIYCPFFTAINDPKYCTIPQLKSMKSWDRFKGYGGVIMPIWESNINDAISSLSSRISQKFRYDNRLKWMSLCGL
jgi:hypothetical protein